MPSQAIPAVGTQFQVEVTSGVYESMADVVGIGGPNQSREFIDVTSLDTTGKRREFIGSFIDSGEISLNMNYVFDNLLTMLSFFEDDEPHGFRIVLPDGVGLAFDAWVSAVPLDIQAGDAIKMNCTIKVTGEIDVISSVSP